MQREQHPDFGPKVESPTVRQASAAGPRDDTTRFLCAAAHLNPDFAEQAIREFLVEPTRSVAPSPGVHAALVLDAAVAARSRAKLRDFALLGLFVLCLVTLALGLSVSAFVFGLAVALGAAALHHPAVGKTLGARGRRMALGAFGIAVLAISLIYWIAAISALSSPAPEAPGGLSTVDTGVPGWSIASVILVWLMLVVLLADEIHVWQLITERFRRGGLGIGVVTPPARTGRYAQALAHYASAAPVQGDDQGPLTPVTVYRGFHPFVGAGVEVRPWSMAIPLQATEHPAPNGKGRLTTDLLYRTVRTDIATLRAATSLSPSRRLAELSIQDRVVIPAEELIDHFLIRDPDATTFLPTLDGTPVRVLPRQQADALAASAKEWARYYLCLQLETWDRDLVLSVFVHFAMDDQTLYLEWTPCVLPPVQQRYRRIDTWRRSLGTPMLQAIGEWVALPITIFERTLRACRWIRPLPNEAGRNNPDRYGALQSLREMAADNDVQNYFQLSDIERYLKVVEDRFVRSVGRILHEHGYSSELFRSRIESVINNNSYFSSSFFGGNFAGPVNTGANSGQMGGSGVIGQPAAGRKD
jgi:hypothetical protein